MLNRVPVSLCLLLALSVGLGCARTVDPGDPGAPDNDAGDRDDSTEDGEGSSTLDAWFETAGCPHEDPPTVFTGDLRYIASMVPEGGSWDYGTEGGRVASVEGEVDWEAGELWSRIHFLEGYPVVYSEEWMEFELGVDGDYEATMDVLAVMKDGETFEASHIISKEGCFRWDEALDIESGRLTETVSELVSADQLNWSSISEPPDGEGEYFTVDSVNTSDWRTEEHFLADDLATEVSPDREGDCVHEPDGLSVCVATTYWADGGIEWSTLTTELEGHTTSEWERSWNGDEIPDAWGTTYQSYEGSGWSSWTTIIYGEDGADDMEITCSGEFDENHEGTYTCSDGSEGSFHGVGDG